MSTNGKLFVVGFGPGNFEHITKRAVEALQESDYIIGYKTYVELIQGLLTDQTIISTGMTEEVSRAQEAVKQAELGKKVAVISSGDAGVYGMAGLVYEVLIEKGWKEETGVGIEVIPGISAINSCASLLGAPVMHDSCTISLSDHLTPWELIAKRVEAAAMADFVIALYNPRSGRRTRQIVETQKILLRYRSPDTPVGLVKSAYRDRQDIVITNLKDMLNHDIGMLTTVIIGNSSTFLYDDKIITPRGYQRKYTLNSEKQPLKPHQRLQKEAEPWALDQEADSVQEAFTESAGGVGLLTKAPEKKPASFEMAMEALSRVKGQTVQQSVEPIVQQKMESVFELAVSPGVANKQFTPKQMMTLAEVVGEKGTMEYTPNHKIVLKIPTTDPEVITGKLQSANFLLSPIGDVLTLKACDFCDGEKTESIPYADEIHRVLGGMKMPKELNIGFNGCGMACYSAVMDDIGIVFRKGKFDLFLGAKPVGRTAHPGQPVAEGIEPEQLVELITDIVAEYKQNAHPNERLFKYFKRSKKIQNFSYQDIAPKINIEPAPCED
ncbi:precorrin-3B C(17)-methyltransferase [Bacillus sp. ISL-4]|uniref:precorrin-3B C(17)-methyltransferase n=1 Tax=Bacillus sp. ISL-4 TaxID=2819125 RepID=UPI001BE5C783|nr:precorrin-3B C(17)-methyltransferase [Bacillus sp. ISL-4]MBT2668594.1 precorrin-3B C(17)-methyltransferase [Bacillus sp. ISL-4]MBT2674009.1 precorrin-3B C(17)-methyltransferase [Streptomyces sp. ISL-14]